MPPRRVIEPNLRPLDQRLASVMAAMRGKADAGYRHDLKARYGIDAPTAIGVRMSDLKAIAKPLGKDQPLAEAMWDTGVYEARLLTSMVADPRAVTPALADRWRADFDNWAVCDTLCFNLLDRVPFAFDLVDRWARLNDEFGRRAGFALLASMAGHRKGESADYLFRLPLIEEAACDGRNFVKKGVSWALRSIGGKADPDLRAAARALADRLAASNDRATRWVGKDAQREFARNDAKKAAKTP